MENRMANISWIISSLRNDSKDIREDMSESQQSTYSQCKYITLLIIHLLSCFVIYSAQFHPVSPCFSSSAMPVGGWFVPGAGSLCPPTSPHSQFGSPLSVSPSHGCERYSTLRNHRSAPYTSPYAHRTNSPSEYPSLSFLSSYIQELHHFLTGH